MARCGCLRRCKENHRRIEMNNNKGTNTKLFSIKRDFTFTKYIELCRKMLSSDYSMLTVEQYFTKGNKPDKFVIIRHDVYDGADLPYTLAMARKEAELGIAATYHFRVIDDVFKPKLIKEAVSLSIG